MVNVPKPKPKPAAGGGATRETFGSTEQGIYATLFSFFRGKGFTVARAQEAAGAFLGNFKIESGFNPNAYNPGENAHGYAQWENGRWSGGNGLQHYAATHQLSPTSDPAERGYLLYELTHGYSGVVDSLRTNTGGIDSATQIVQSRFEGSTPDSLGARQGAARSILADIRSGRPLTGGPLSSTNPGVGLPTGGSSSSGGAGFAGGGSGGSFLGIPGTGGSVSEWVSKLVEHSLFVVGGLILIIVGIMIIAKSSGVDVSEINGNPSEKTGDAGAHKSGGKTAAAAAAL